MSEYITADLRRQVAARDRYAYCQTSEANSGIPMTIDHIIPIAVGGPTTLDNLCLACRSCNEAKGKRTIAVDFLSGQDCALFKPLEQNWNDHFTWSPDGVEIEAKTPIGRATIAALRMNNPVICAARRRWVLSGWHPPKDLETL